jgi:hypothetical protein
VSDPQNIAESLDDEELPAELIPDRFIEAEDWDAGAGSSEENALDNDDGVDEDEGEIGQEREGTQPAEEAAMHLDRRSAPPD